MRKQFALELRSSAFAAERGGFDGEEKLIQQRTKSAVALFNLKIQVFLLVQKCFINKCCKKFSAEGEIT